MSERLSRREYSKRFRRTLAELLAVTKLGVLDRYSRHGESHASSRSPEQLAVSFFRNEVEAIIRNEQA
jgi:hypothetical protein